MSTPLQPRRSVYIAYTGGTIGMQRGNRGYRPEPGFLARQMDEIPVLRHPAMPRYTVSEYQPLLDSSNMTPGDWMKLGEDIYENYDRYDGFIVLHGTDTMSYSASALSFMFDGLAKPIVFTGSQIPLVELRTDARENLIASLLIAASGEVPEVCLFVGSRLLRGNRSTKTSADRFRAFRSPNFPPLGDAGVELVIHHDRLLRRPRRDLVFHRVGGVEVADVRFFPGMSPRVLEQFLAPPLQGAVLHTYGLGNAPDDESYLRPIREACDRGVVLVNCTQCLEGTVNMTGYATGNALADAGVVSGYDMTPEAALTKLYWLLSLGLDPDETRRRMGLDLRGELTSPMLRETASARRVRRDEIAADERAAARDDERPAPVGDFVASQVGAPLD